MKKASANRGNRWPKIDLRAMEEEVLAEGREWMRRRMEEKLQEASRLFSPGGANDAQVRPASRVED